MVIVPVPGHPLLLGEPLISVLLVSRLGLAAVFLGRLLPGQVSLVA